MKQKVTGYFLLFTLAAAFFTVAATANMLPLMLFAVLVENAMFVAYGLLIDKIGEHYNLVPKTRYIPLLVWLICTFLLIGSPSYTYSQVPQAYLSLLLIPVHTMLGQRLINRFIDLSTVVPIWLFLSITSSEFQIFTILEEKKHFQKTGLIFQDQINTGQVHLLDVHLDTISLNTILRNQGHFVSLSFSACLPCRMKMQFLNNTKVLHKVQNIITIYGNELDDTSSYLEAVRNYPDSRIFFDPHNTLMKQLSINPMSYPIEFFITAGGKISHPHMGYTNYQNQFFLERYLGKR